MRRLFLFLTVPLLATFVMSAAAFAGDRAPLPRFKAKTVQGKKVKAADYEGKVLVVAFWATWCKPCLQELPFLADFQEKYKDQGFELLIVSTDGPETAAKVRSTLKRKKLDKIPCIHDADGSLAAKLNPRGTNPFTVYVDRSGRVAESHEGFSPGDEKKAEKLIQKLLKEKWSGE
jgi:peroxiredoxin